MIARSCHHEMEAAVDRLLIALGHDCLERRGSLLEGRAGQRSAQGWEFYAITGTLFLTFAFPGFVYQYLVRRSKSVD